ncbi:hypothetical protein JCM3774_004065 [Rhodotorula dairenensis]
MLFARLAIVAALCAGTTLASTAESVNHVARALHGANGLARRDAAEDLQAAQAIASGLAQAAGQAVANGGECSSECKDWVSAMGECITASTLDASAQCVCKDSAIAQMSTCGNCLGGENTEGADSLAKVCADYVSQLGGASSSSSSDDSSSKTSSATSASAAVTDAASSVASSVSDPKSSAKSVASSLASAITAEASATSAPGDASSGANKLAIVGSAVLAAAGAATFFAF